MPPTSPKQERASQSSSDGLESPTTNPSTLASSAPGGRFPNTHWSIVLAAASGDAPVALEKLCRAYWKPLFVAARRFGHSEHDAQDLAQAFFEKFLEKGYIRAADPHRGRFRTFLFTSFRHFIHSEWVKNRAAKRGGAKAFVPWESLPPGEAACFDPHSNQPAEVVFDRQWALGVFDAALGQLRNEFTVSGKCGEFDQLKQFLSQIGNNADYARVGECCSMTAGAVAVAVRRLRVRYGELLRAQIASTVANPEDVEDELRLLKKALIG